MNEFFKSLFGPELMLYGNSNGEQMELLWLNIGSDALIALSCLSIPLALLYLISKRRDMDFRWMFYMFCAFVLACGVSHILGIWTVGHGTSYLTGLVKLAIASVSAATAIVIWPQIPKALAMRSPAELERLNRKLHQEIEEHLRARERLAESESRFRGAFEIAPRGMALVGADGKWLQVNRALCEITGYSEEELLATDFQSITHPEDLDADLAYVNRLLTGEISYYHMEKRYVHKNRHCIWILLSVSLVRDADGKPVHFVAQIQDITERKRNDQALRALAELGDYREGERFHCSAVERIASIFDVECVLIAQHSSKRPAHLVTLAFWKDGGLIPNTEYPARESPCGEVLLKQDCFYCESVARRFPRNAFLSDNRIQSYAGVPVVDAADGVLGTVAIMSRKRLFEQKSILSALKLFALKVAGELQRERAERRFRDVFEFAPDAVALVNQAGEITLCNRHAAALFDFPKEELIGKQIQTLILAEGDDPGPRSNGSRPFTGGKIPSKSGTLAGVQAKRKDGNLVPVSVSFAPLETHNGPLVAFAIRDVSEQYRTQKALQKERDFVTTILDTSAVLILVLDSQGRIARFNPACEKLSQYLFHEVQGKRFADWFLPPEEAKAFRRTFQKIRAGYFGSIEEFSLISRDGRFHRISWSHSTITNEAGKVEFVVCTGIDVTERDRNRRLLENQRDILHLFVKHTPIAVAMFDRQLRYLAASDRWIQDYRLEGRDIIGKHHYDIFPEIGRRQDWIDIHQRCLQGAVERRDEDCLIREDGREEWLRWEVRPWYDETGEVGGIMMFTEVITGQKQAQKQSRLLEKQLRQAQKMEAIGTLAGGVAHDFNNILGTVMGNAELAKLELDKETSAGHYLENILTATYRARDLVQQILMFSRQQDQERAPLRLQPLIGEVIRFLRCGIPAGIEIRLAVAADCPSVFADATQIHQVLMNLCTNAVQALRDRKGVIELGLARVQLDEKFVSIHEELEAGDYVCLSVKDNGPGITPETQDRIFEPFFTTKQPGQGTGLGLSVVHGIIKHHGGAITVESRPGEGALFRVYLPVYQKTEPAEQAQSDPMLLGDGEHILFLDDEEHLAASGKKMLEHLGYAVTTETDPSKALEIFREHPDRFQLLITDYSMPQMDGIKVAKKVRRLLPEIPIILTSGHVEAKKIKAFKMNGSSCEVLYKPGNMKALSQTVHRALKKN